MAQSIITLSGDEASLFKAFQKIIEQQAKVDGGYKKIKDASRDAAAAAKAAAKEEEADNKRRQQSIDNVATSVAGLVTGYLSISSAVALVNKAQAELVTNQEKSLTIARELAAAQQEAAKNLVGQTPAQISETLQKTVPEIAKRSGFADLPKLTVALGSAASIVGEEQARGVVEQSARITRFTPGELQNTATAASDILKATGLKDAREALSLLASTGSVARPEQLAKLATGAAVAINSSIGQAPQQDRVEAAKEGVALYAALSKVDPQGQSAATATGQFIKQISDVFTDTKVARERDAKIEQLTAALKPNELAIVRADLNLEEATQKAGFFGAGDTSLEAREARAAAEIAQENTQQARRKQALDAAELQRLEEMRNLTANDPGTLTGRLERVRGSDLLRTSVLENLAGEQKFQPLMRQLVEGAGTDTGTQFSNSLATITTNTKAFEALADSTVETPQARIVAAENNAQLARTIQQATDTDGQIRAAVSGIANEALSASSTGFVTSMSNVGSRTMDGWFRTLDSTPGFLESQQKNLQERLLFLGNTDAETSKVETVAAALESINTLARLPETLEAVAKSGRDQSAFLEKQIGIAEETKAILRSIEQINNRPNPGAIREQAGAQPVTVGGF